MHGMDRPDQGLSPRTYAAGLLVWFVLVGAIVSMFLLQPELKAPAPRSRYITLPRENALGDSTFSCNGECGNLMGTVLIGMRTWAIYGGINDAFYGRGELAYGARTHPKLILSFVHQAEHVGLVTRYWTPPVDAYYDTVFENER